MVTLPPVSIVGLGKLGASMVAAIASRGGTVVGVDVNPDAVAALSDGRAPVQETNLEATIAANRSRIRATLDVAAAVHQTAITFVIVPTPSDERGAFSTAYAAHAFEAVARALATKPTYHVVVLTSTVLPGATRGELLPLLERESGKRAGQDFGLCYSPEFIALGSVIRDFLNPDFTLVGELDARSGDYLEAYYAEIMANSPPCMRMSLENAELTKISINSYVTMKITFANMLASLCERIPGGDVDVVTHAVGADRRVGDRYLKGGLGYGGPCFPRDNVALEYFARTVGEEALLPGSTDAANARIPERLADRVASLAAPGSTIAILGLAYKPRSHVIEESQSVALARLLHARGYQVMAFDPLVPGLPGAADIQVVDSLEACLQAADLIVVATPDPLFAGIDGASLVGRERPLTVVDCWRHARGLSRVAGVTYVAAGRAS
jgi:UDPglucose 6-dehydrogenase